MRKIILLILILALTAVPVRAMDYTAPSAPDSAEDLMPAETESFAEGLLEILKDAVEKGDLGFKSGKGIQEWTPEEVAAFQAAGAVPVTMGPRIFRTETAGLAALIMLLYERGEYGAAEVD